MTHLAEPMAALIAVEAIKEGIPVRHLEGLLDIAAKGYSLGRKDALIHGNSREDSFSLSSEQTALLRFEAINKSISSSYIQIVLTAAGRGYHFGYSDAKVNITRTPKEYQLDFAEILKLAGKDIGDLTVQ